MFWELDPIRDGVCRICCCFLSTRWFNPLTVAAPPAGDEDALHRHDVRRRGEQRAVRPVLQAARRRGPLSGGGLEAVQVRQEQPRQDGHSGRGVMEVRRWRRRERRRRNESPTRERPEGSASASDSSASLGSE